MSDVCFKSCRNDISSINVAAAAHATWQTDRKAGEQKKKKKLLQKCTNRLATDHWIHARIDSFFFPLEHGRFSSVTSQKYSCWNLLNKMGLVSFFSLLLLRLFICLKLQRRKTKYGEGKGGGSHPKSVTSVSSHINHTLVLLARLISPLLVLLEINKASEAKKWVSTHF